VGEHNGVHHFTIGQRKWIGSAAREPLYVISTEPATQRVVVGAKDDLLRSSLIAGSVNWISLPGITEPIRAEVKIRNRHAGAPACLEPMPESNRVRVLFDEPQRAVTPGQAAVFYQDEVVIGGGWIE
jgi:tRNA-specific 2-thiouridylase